MVGRQQDVNLVIKARDEAKRVLDSINASLDELTKSQEKAGKSADRTGDLVGQLGDEFQSLNRQLQGLAALGKIAGELDKASTAVNNIDADVKQAATSLADLARESQMATQRANQLRAQLEIETRTRDENTAALRTAKKELSDLDRLLKQVENSQSKLNRTNAAAPATRGVGLEAGAVQSSARASAATFLADEQRRLTGEVAQYTAQIERSKQAVKDLSPAVTAAARNQEQLARQTENAAGSLRNQRADLNGARENLAAIRTISDQANARLANLAGTQDKVAAASARMAAQMAAAKARIDALAGAKAPAIASPQTTGVAGDEQALARQRRAMLEARREWMASQEAVRKLAQEMRIAEQPTEELGRAFGEAQAKARLAKEAYEQQAVALHRLGGAAQSSFREFAQSTNQMRAAGAATGQLAGNVSAAVAAQDRLADAARRTGSGMDAGARGTNGFRSALGSLYGESRQAMSIMQRLRGEVLSLVTAYVGLHAAINQIGAVISAFQTIEAAQSRLGVVFNQDTARVAQELAWLNGEASRLGITFQVLSDEYGKFAVAAQAANFSAENTRKIFTSVAEAARVNKLSVDQMSGVFLALQQMISKGKVTSEELRRQLGDRLTGAFNIFAEAIGVSTAELDEMMRKGEVLANESNLLKFADELNERFGPQLASALETTTTEIGRFRNEIFNAQLRVGEGGFIEGLNVALRELNEWFASRAGRDFFLALGEALGAFVQVLAQVPEHFGLIQVAVTAFIALKLGQSVGAMAASFLQATTGARTFAGALVALRASTVATVATLSTLRGLLLSIRTLAASTLAFFGGVPGLIVAGIVTAISLWIGRVDDATSALDEHQRQLDAITAGYIAAGKGAKNWADEIKGVSLLQAQDDLEKMSDALDEIRAKAVAPVDAFGMDTKGTVAAVTRAVEAFRAGTIGAAEFKAEIDRIAALDPQFARELALGLQEIADEALTVEERVAKAEAKLRLIEGTATDTDRALLGLADTTETANRAFNTEALDAYKNALDELKGAIPELVVEMKRLKDIGEINASWAKILEQGPPTKEAQDLYNRAIEAVNLEAFSKDVQGSLTQATVGLLKTFEGFRSEAYWDSNAFRAGFGSDTVTLADGSIQKITEGMRVSQEDALRDLVRRIGEFQNIVKRQIGNERFEAFSTEQQAALTSIAYNYGSLPDRILNAVKTGTAAEIAAAVRGLAGDNNGVNANRRNAEAQILEVGSAQLTQQRVDAEAEINRYVDERVEILREEAAAREESKRELEIQKEIQRAENEAKKSGLTLSQEQLVAIREATGARWDAVHAAEAEKAKIDEAKAAVAELVGLDQQRASLLKEMELAHTQGDNDRLEQTKLQIAEINAKILELIPNAQAMATALGDEKMVAALQKVALNTDLVNQKVATAASNVNILGLNFQQMKQLGQSLASGLAGVVDKFAMAIANAEDATEALKNAFLQFAADFLRQIAQMIIQQAVLNALQGFMGGGAGSGGNVLGAMFHTGGIAGRGGTSRAFDPSIFANALRYHTGGVAGLRPNEVPAVLERNEEVLTTDDPRHQFNGGGGPPKAGDTKIVNAFDTASFLEAALATRVGEQAILNFVRANSSAFKGALG